MKRIVKFLVIAFFLNVASNHLCHGTDTLLVHYFNLPYAVRSVASDSAGNIFISGGKGLQQYVDSAFIVINPDYIYDIIELNGKVINIKDHPKYQSKFPAGLYDNWARFLVKTAHGFSQAIDKNGKIWVSNGVSLFVFRIDSTFVKTHEGKSIRGMLVRSGRLFSNTYSGLYIDTNRVMPEIPIGDGKVIAYGDSVLFLFGGLAVYHPASDTYNVYHHEKFERLPDSSGVGFFIRDAIFYKDTLWLGTTMGFGYWAGGKPVITHPGIYVESISLENGKVWILTYEKGVYHLQNGKLVLEPLPVGPYYSDIEYDSYSGDYFFATNQGILRFGSQGTSFFNSDKGLSNNEVYGVLSIGDGAIWASTYSGLNRLDLRQNSVEVYLNHVEFNRRSFCDADSLFLFGSINGIYAFDPLDFKTIQEPMRSDDHLSVRLWVVGVFILLTTGLSVSLLVLIRKKQQVDASLAESSKKLFILEVEQIISSDLTNTTVESIAEKLNLSQRSLYRKFEEYEIKPGEFVRSIRQKRVEELIRQQHYKVDEISKATGYSIEYLKKLIKKNNM